MWAVKTCESVKQTTQNASAVTMWKRLWTLFSVPWRAATVGFLWCNLCTVREKSTDLCNKRTITTVATRGILKSTSPFNKEAETNDKGHKGNCLFALSLPSPRCIPDEPAISTCSYNLPPAPWLPTPVRAALDGAFSVPGDAKLQRALFWLARPTTKVIPAVQVWPVFFPFFSVYPGAVDGFISTFLRLS